MTRNQNESFSDYKARRTAANKQRKAALKPELFWDSSRYGTIQLDDKGRRVENPELKFSDSRSIRRQNTGRAMSNKKGIQLVVVGKMKYHKTVQVVEKNFKWDKEPEQYVNTPKKRIYHSTLV